MATTASDIIRRALRLIRVIDAAEALSASDAQDALATLNAMLAEWYEADIGFPDYSFATLTTEIATDAADREAIAYQLAPRLAPEYGKAITPELAVIAEQAMGRLRLRYFQPGTVSTDLPSQVSRFDIVSGDTL